MEHPNVCIVRLCSLFYFLVKRGCFSWAPLPGNNLLSFHFHPAFSNSPIRFGLVYCEFQCKRFKFDHYLRLSMSSLHYSLFVFSFEGDSPFLPVYSVLEKGLAAFLLPKLWPFHENNGMLYISDYFSVCKTREVIVVIVNVLRIYSDTFCCSVFGTL